MALAPACARGRKCHRPRVVAHRIQRSLAGILCRRYCEPSRRVCRHQCLVSERYCAIDQSRSCHDAARLRSATHLHHLLCHHRFGSLCCLINGLNAVLCRWSHSRLLNPCLALFIHLSIHPSIQQTRVELNEGICNLLTLTLSCARVMTGVEGGFCFWIGVAKQGAVASRVVQGGSTGRGQTRGDNETVTVVGRHRCVQPPQTYSL